MIKLVHKDKFKRELEQRGLKFIEQGADGVVMWESKGELYLILIEPVNADGYCPFQVQKLLNHIDSGVATMPPKLTVDDDEDADLGDCVGKKGYNVIPIRKK